ncbi:caspase family protein [Streptomyces sp. AC550_RSS872]|uniref:caspase family protein n=1 Tax=Streptomyces sp. AC550_RSS872 TaxID=2823689 RepID=UPI001C27B57E|nr:caspase family protein [Streptomyces sp. AC550_RSS872]
MSDGTAAGDGGPRRFLIATAVSHYPHAPEWDRPGLVEARRTLVELFTTKLGYKHVSDLGANPTQQQLLRELREFCRSPERRADDIVAVYIAGHGELLDNDEYVLLASDTNPDDLHDALPPSTLARKILAGTKVRRLLLMLDTCFSGQGGNELLAAMAKLKNSWREKDAGLAVITSAQPNELAQTGAFPELLAEAVNSLATAGYTPPLLSLGAVVEATRNNPKRPDFQHIGWEIIGLTGEIPPFLPNAKHSNRLSHTDMALQQAAEWEEQDSRRDVEFRTRLLRRAMGHRDEERVGWWFSGRHRALRDITAWLTELPYERPALVVTGDPGSGKTAVLGLLAAVSDPEYRRTVPLSSLGLSAELLPPSRAIRTAVYAQNLTDQQVVRALAAALRLPPVEAVADLLNHLNAGPEPDRPRVVLIDGLDEAATPSALCGQVLRPLMELAGDRLRLLLGTRPHLLAPLGLERGDQVDLDSPRYADPQAVLAYAVRNLVDAHPESPYLECENDLRLGVARAVAAAAGHSFLVARITAGTLAATPVLPDPRNTVWRRSLPSAAADAMHRDLHQRFGEGADQILDLLRPLAYAEGQGLPWEDIWAPLASELSGRRYTNEDLRQLRRDAGAYVVEAVEDGRSVYRLYHEAMAEYLRQGRDLGEAHRAFTDALRRAVPPGLDGGRDWARAHPYALRHIAVHASRAGLLDGLVAEPEYLVHADTDSLVPLLLEVESDTARLHAAIYRASLEVHWHLDAGARRQVLALDAARYNEPSLLEAFNSRSPESAWKPVAASGSHVDGNLRNVLTGHDGAVLDVACAEVEGRTIAVTASTDTTVRIWDLTTGRPIGSPMTGHTGSVRSVACTALNGRPIAVTGSDDKTVRIWDLTTGRPIGTPMTGHTGSVAAVVCTALDGRPIAVTGSDATDTTVRIWDLTTGRPMGEPMDVGDRVCPLAVATVRDRPVVVTGPDLSMWDLATRRELMRLPSDSPFWASKMACTELDGHPVVVFCGVTEQVHLWDLETWRLLGTFEGPDNWLEAVACTRLDGRPVAVVGSDYTMRVVDLTTCREIALLTGHTMAMGSLTCTSLAGQPIVVSSAWDTVRIWDLTTRKALGRPVIGHTDLICAADLGVLKGRPVFVTSAADHTVRRWDVSTGLPVGEPLKGPAQRSWAATACTVLRGRQVVVTGSLDGRLQARDLETWQPVGPPLEGSTTDVTGVTCAVVEGRLVALGWSLDGTTCVWDLETGKALYPPLRGDRELHTKRTCTVLDGRPLAITSDSEGTRIWDLATQRPVAEFQHHARSLACGGTADHPLLVTCGMDHALRVWDLRTGQPLGEPMTGHSKPTFWVTCTLVDGHPVAVTSSYDNTIRIWDLTDRTALDVIHVSGASKALLLPGSDTLACTFGSDVAVFTRR